MRASLINPEQNNLEFSVADEMPQTKLSSIIMFYM